MADVLLAPFHGASHFSSSPMHSSHTDLTSLDTSNHYLDSANTTLSHTSTDFETPFLPSTSSSAPSSPQLHHRTFSRQPSYNSTRASSLSLDARVELEYEQDDNEDDDILFPSYDGSGAAVSDSASPTCDSRPTTPASPPREDDPDLPSGVRDDHDIRPEPTRHVDYLSHDWKEEDIWSSWRYVIARRSKITNSMRLENASWRTWMKAKNNLRTISPEALNWLKDCDVTWLYGPLQTDWKAPITGTVSPPPSRLSHSSSFVGTKPILKKKSASEAFLGKSRSAAILEKSLSSHSLLKQSVSLLRAQQSSPSHRRPSYHRVVSDFGFATYTPSSVVNTPTEHEGSGLDSLRPSFTFPEPQSPSECKHVNFSNTVRQVRAVESDEDEVEVRAEERFSEDEDDDGGLMMRPSPSAGKLSNRSTPRGSFSSESKTIVPLPSTTLKYRGDTPEPDQAQQSRGFAGLWSRSRKLSPSPSQETLRPPRPEHNFLLGDDCDDPDDQWNLGSTSSPYEDEEEPGPGLRRTESGMFMPYDESEEEAAMNSTLFGQFISVVNTVKDISHVVWNVGWRGGA